MSKFIKTTSILCLIAVMIGCFSGCRKTETPPPANGLLYETYEEFEQNGVHMHPERDEFLRYAIYDTFVQVIECVSEAEVIVIPDTYKNLPVIGVRKECFQDNTTMKQLVLGANVLKIDDHAFANCTALTQVKMSNSVNDIGDGAFFGCIALTSIIIPPNVNTIPSGAFSGCKSLKKVIIESAERSASVDPENVAEINREIQSGAFTDCDHLSIMWIPEDITAVPESIIGGTTPKPLICGGDSTASSYFATLQCLDYELVDRDEFDAHARLYNNFDMVDRSEMGETITSGVFDITLTDVKYYNKLGSITSGENQTLVAITFTITHDNMISQYFDGLDVYCTSTAPNKNNVIEEFYKEPLMLHSKVLNMKYPAGTIYPDSHLQGVIVLRVSNRFESIKIHFGGADAPFVI